MNTLGEYVTRGPCRWSRSARASAHRSSSGRTSSSIARSLLIGMLSERFGQHARVQAVRQRDSLVWAGIAAAVAAGLVWLGPPGADAAAHVYQRALFLHQGFVLWNNFWYAGRYSFVTYSLLYYPLAALIGIKLLAVLSVAAAVIAFSAVVRHEWGRQSRWAERAFAVVWAFLVLSGAYPLMLGCDFALLSLSA